MLFRSESVTAEEDAPIERTEAKRKPPVRKKVKTEEAIIEEKKPVIPAEPAPSPVPREEPSVEEPDEEPDPASESTAPSADKDLILKGLAAFHANEE